MSIRIEVQKGHSNQLVDTIWELEKAIFPDPYSREKIDRESSTKHKLLSLIAYFEDQAVAFKVGYAYNDRLFQSWIGGVTPSHRGQGIARDLMNKQHEVARELGYKTVRTHTYTKFKPMLILNLRCGFEIVGVINNAERQDTTIVLEKQL